MAKIEVQNLKKEYKGGLIKAVDSVSFVCKNGDFFCLLGPAGAGKSTTIKLLGGIELVDEGKILFDDQDVTDQLPKDRDVAIAFETYALYPQRTVRENLRFPLQAPVRKNELTIEQVEKRVVEIANLLGIGELLDRLPRQLSGGQRQRVALGRALVRKPKAYLLDEPIAHLDAKLRHRMRGELKRIQKELGVTTIYTTPDQLEALSLADTIAVLNNGKIEQSGTPDEIYKHPANVFVARFVGEPPMNILKGSYQDDHLFLDNALKLPLSKEQKGIANKLTKGKVVLVGIRAKDIHLVAENSPKVMARAAVKSVQVLGETSVVTITLDGAEMYVKLATQQAPMRGDQVSLAFISNDCHFFDPSTQRRIEVI